jgi:hypothetical protein
MSYLIPTFDELFNLMLTDYQNKGFDIDEDALANLKAACMTSALWGAYKHQEYIEKQIWPDTADTEGLEHHASIKGLTRNTNETDSEFLARLLDDYRKPAAGGNKYDYPKWALEVTNVKKAYCFPVAWGTGTVDVVIFADPVATGSEIPSSHTKNGVNTSVVAFKLVDSAADFTPVRKGDKALNDTLSTEATVLDVEDQYTLLLDLDIFTATPQNYTIKSLVKQTQEHITDVRPVNARLATVRAPSILTQNVTMSVSGLTATEKALVQADIESYMNN